MNYRNANKNKSTMMSKKDILKKIKNGPENVTMCTAQRDFTDSQTNNSIPSIDAIEEMRDWSMENEL